MTKRELIAKQYNYLLKQRIEIDNQLNMLEKERQNLEIESE